jgi:CDP-diacylglycerol---glycerol-3-phosphate 3-phosphatidyltransferase
VLLSFGLVFAKGAGLADVELLAPAIYAMAVLTAFTVAQRVWHVRRQLRTRAGETAASGNGAAQV